MQLNRDTEISDTKNLGEAVFNRFYHLYGGTPLKLCGYGVGVDGSSYIVILYVTEAGYEIADCKSEVTLQVNGNIVTLPVRYELIGKGGFLAE